MNLLNDFVEPVKKIARQAGDAILEIYHNPSLFNIEIKADESPLTAADKASNQIICDGLQHMETIYPIISEENKEVDSNIRFGYKRYWLIDPLDGTKEFIKRNDEFTVNIALIENGKVIFGVVYVPVYDDMYWGVQSGGAYYSNGSETIQIKSLKKKLGDAHLKIVCSRSHLNEETQSFINQFDQPEKVAKGSSLKFLIIAKGEADLYPRLGPTMEWDTAAAQIILEEAGGKVINVDTKAPVCYNKESLRNPHFIAYGNII